MKKKFYSKEFKNADEMDRYLETADLSEAFRKYGVVKKPKMKKINLDLPEVTVMQIDLIAQKVGVARQPLIKIWIHERLKTESSKN